MRRRTKKLIGILLSVFMLLSMMPFHAFAGEIDEGHGHWSDPVECIQKKS